MANIKETADILDVLVIGSGIAGLSAAVSACDAGARVTILERSTEEEYGGNTRWTEAYFRMKDWRGRKGLLVSLRPAHGLSQFCIKLR